MFETNLSSLLLTYLGFHSPLVKCFSCAAVSQTAVVFTLRLSAPCPSVEPCTEDNENDFAQITSQSEIVSDVHAGCMSSIEF